MNSGVGIPLGIRRLIPGMTYSPVQPEPLRTLVKRCACGCGQRVSQNKGLAFGCLLRLQKEAAERLNKKPDQPGGAVSATDSVEKRRGEIRTDRELPSRERDGFSGNA